MHSRIMGVTTLEEWNKRQDMELDEDETYPFADYVDHDVDDDDDFNWFIDVLGRHSDPTLMTVDSTNRTIQFHKGFKAKYFKDQFAKLVKAIMNPKMFDSFCGELKRTNHCSEYIPDMYDLKKLVDEEYSFYVADEFNCWETLDMFVRHIDYDVVYKVYDSLDYYY